MSISVPPAVDTVERDLAGGVQHHDSALYIARGRALHLWKYSYIIYNNIHGVKANVWRNYTNFKLIIVTSLQICYQCL